ncbi:MAG: hypothetical protein J6Y30_08915 [Treponema sp.]|nr:hypothetical protein [Treponema sp.]
MKKVFVYALLMLTAFPIFAEEAYIRSAEASSTYSELLSGKEVVYDALNAFDGKLDTAWVEDKSDSGIGETLTVSFYEPVKIDEIRIINGFAHNDLYKKNNRVKKLNIGCVNEDLGPCADYTLKDDCDDFQSVHLEETPEKVTAVIFTIQDVYRGTKYNDTCIDEIRFYYKGSLIPNKNVERLKQAKKDSKAAAQKNYSALLKKLSQRAERKYQTKDGKYSGYAFLLPLDSGVEKGYVISIDDGIGFFECWFKTVDDYKRTYGKNDWQWLENPSINISDYFYIVPHIGYRYNDNRHFTFDSSTNSIVTENRTVAYTQNSFSGGYETRDYLLDTDPKSTYELFSSVTEPNYRIDINGIPYLLIDSECLFVNIYDGI